MTHGCTVPVSFTFERLISGHSGTRLYPVRSLCSELYVRVAKLTLITCRRLFLFSPNASNMENTQLGLGAAEHVTVTCRTC